MKTYEATCWGRLDKTDPDKDILALERALEMHQPLHKRHRYPKQSGVLVPKLRHACK